MRHTKILKILSAEKNSFFENSLHLEFSEIMICESLNDTIQPHGHVEVHRAHLDPKQGYYMHSEGEMVNGQRQGEWLKYSEDGEAYSMMTYVNDRIEGEKHTVFIESQKTQSVIPYKNGEKHGFGFFYNRDGTLIKIAEYQDGKKHGWTEKFYKEPEYNDALKSKTYYENGLAEGLGYYYKPNGQLRAVVLYQNGVPYGEATANMNASLASMRLIDNARTMFGKLVGANTRSVEQRNEDQLEILEVRYPDYFGPDFS